MSAIEKRHSDPERAESRRRQVLEAAAVCFSRSGFHGASMAEISKAADMSAGHIYNYFDSKDAIITAFVYQRMEEVAAILRDMEKRDDPLQGILDDASVKLAEHFEPVRLALSMEIYAEASRNPGIAKALHEWDLDSRTRFRALLKGARERRALAVDDATLDGRVDAVFTLYQGLPLRALYHPDLDYEALVESFRVAMKALLMS